MKVNGREQLGCVANILAEGTKEVVVEPLGSAPLIADLVVDMTPVLYKVSAFCQLHPDICASSSV